MTREEIESRIMICELRANECREVGNTKTANRYDNEKHKWEKLLSDLDLLSERKIKELTEYKRGYFDLQEQNQKYKEVINKAIKWVRDYMNEWDVDDDVYHDLTDLLNLLKEVEHD